MPPTIRDVARKINLSITTVSRALDGYDDVAETTRQLVINTAQEMGYRPNRAARQLRRQRSETIGYILPASQLQFADPFFSEFIAGLGDEASAQNYDLLITTAPPDTPKEKIFYERWIQSGKVDGVVLNRMRLQDWRVRFLVQNRIPFVSMERSHEEVDFIGVEADSYQGFIELVEFLAQRGHCRIAYIGTRPGLKIQEDRLSGYQDGLSACGLEQDSSLILEGDLTPKGGYEAAQRLFSLADRPTAVICINDLTAIGVMHAAVDHCLEVGHDLAVTGFDGIADSAHTRPPLTTLDQPVYDMARKLVSMLVTLLNGKILEERQVVLRPRLLVRASTGS